MVRFWAWCGALALLLVLGSAGRVEAKEEERVVSVTMSPLHLLLPVLEVQGELRVAAPFGVSLIGGYGSITVDGGSLGDVDFQVIEVGTQLAFYPLSDFRSLQLGAEAMWLHVSTDEVGQFDATGFASGLAVGPFIGFKMIARPGFTAFIQGGYQFVAVHAEASDDTGNSASDDESGGVLLLNLNLGWSF